MMTLYRIGAARCWLAGWVVMGVLLYLYVGAFPIGSDASGYFNMAKVVESGRFDADQRFLEGRFAEKTQFYAAVPLGFVPVQGDEAQTKMKPTYPIGWPLMLLASAKIAGWDAGPAWLVWLVGMGGLAVFALLVRAEGLSGWWALLGCAALVASPLWASVSLVAMSDAVAGLWCVGALALARLALKVKAWALLAGFCVGMAVLTRPTSVLVALPVVMILGLDVRRCALLALGGAPCAAFLLWFNARAYGSPWTSGYGYVSYLFGGEHVLPTLGHYLRWLPVLAGPLLIGCVWGFKAMRAGSVEKRVGWAHVVWIVLLLGFYASYKHTADSWWYLRFVYAALPSILLIAIWGWRAASEQWSELGKRTAYSWLFLACIGWGWAWSEALHAWNFGTRGEVCRFIDEKVNALVPANAVIVSMETSGTLFYYSPHAILRWDVIEAEELASIVAATRAAGRPLYAALFPNEDEALKRIPGPWVKVAVQERRFALWKMEQAGGVEPR